MLPEVAGVDLLTQSPEEVAIPDTGIQVTTQQFLTQELYAGQDHTPKLQIYIRCMDSTNS